MKTLEAPQIAIIGGGTGTATLLSELKHETPNISAVVNMSDDGGSSGELRRAYGVLPPGDVRQCLAALANNTRMAALMNERITEGPDTGHARGNLLLSRLELHYGDFQRGLDVISKMLRLTGEVVPVTVDKHELVMQDNNEIIRGEYAIAHRRFDSDRPSVWLEPAAGLSPRAEEALCRANVIAIAPGNRYGSIYPALAVSGMREALQESSAHKVLFANILNKPGQTDGWHVADDLLETERYTGEGVIDTVIYNTDVPCKDLIREYGDDEDPVAINPGRFKEIQVKAIGAPLLSRALSMPGAPDPLMPRRRTVIKHDSALAARQLIAIASSRQP